MSSSNGADVATAFLIVVALLVILVVGGGLGWIALDPMFDVSCSYGKAFLYGDQYSCLIR